MKKIPDDYFLDIDDDMLNYIEKESDKCIDFVNNSISVNKGNSYKLLNLLIVGVGASFLLITQSNKVDFFTLLLWFFCIGWTVCLVLLSAFCIKTKKKPANGASPLDLYSQYYKEINCKDKLSLLRRYNLVTIECIIDFLIKEDSRIRMWLDRVIILSVITPVFSLIFSFLVHYLPI